MKKCRNVPKNLKRIALLLLPLLLTSLAVKESRSDDATVWDVLKFPDHFAIMRHALAPGMGDPPDFRLNDCGTQRNLSNAGREQAIKIGKELRSNGIIHARVLSSKWCRCLETADLLGFGKVEELAVLNSFFQEYEKADAQTQALRNWLGRQDLEGAVILVTHQVNITALTNIFPASGEIIVVKREMAGVFTVAGRILIEE